MQVAYFLGLGQVWVVDDNVRACYMMDPKEMAAWTGGLRQSPTLIHFDEAMKRIETHAGLQLDSNSQWDNARDQAGEEAANAKRRWVVNSSSSVRELKVIPDPMNTAAQCVRALLHVSKHSIWVCQQSACAGSDK